MKIKKNDNVIVIAGKDKGKTGKISTVLVKENKIVIDGLNMVKKHQRARKSGEKGTTISISLPMNASNVMIVDPKTGKPSKIGSKIVAGKNVRIAKKSGQEI